MSEILTNEVLTNGTGANGNATNGRASRRMTNSTLPLEQVREHIQSDDADKWDVVVPYRNITLRDGKVTYYDAHAHEVSGYPTTLTPTSWAVTQLCQRLSIPVSYYKRCPTILQDLQVNYWLRENGHTENGNENEHKSHGHEGNGQILPTELGSNGYNGTHKSGTPKGMSAPSQWLLRSKGSTLRGILSEKFSRLDNANLLSSLEPLLGDRFQVEGFALTDESMHLRFVDPQRAREVLPNDDLMVGVHVANSEVGKRAVTVDALVYRLVCSNGLIRLVKGKSLLHQRHLHLSEPRFVQSLQQAMAEALTAASDFIEQLARATQEPVKDVEHLLETVADRWHLTQSFQEQVTRALLNEHHSQHETLYGVVNAFTQAAQQLPADDRYTVEVMAGQLLEHPLSRHHLWQANGPYRDKQSRNGSRQTGQENDSIGVDTSEDGHLLATSSTHDSTRSSLSGSPQTNVSATETGETAVVEW